MLHQHYLALTHWLHLHPHWGWLVAFLIAFTESLAVIGTVVPGSVTMTAIGILAGSGVIQIWSVILSAILGAIVGDGLSYLSGYYLQSSVKKIWPFSTHPNLLIQGQLFFTQHGGKSVFLGRFIGAVRAIVPVVAGTLRFPPRRYFTASILSAIGWAPAYMLPGILIGAVSLELPAHIATELFVVVLLFLAGFWALFAIAQYVYRKTRRYFNRILDVKWEKWSLQPSKRWICYALQNGEHPETHGQLLIFLTTLTLFFLFLFIFLNVVIHGPLTHYNNLVYHWFRGLRTLTLDEIFIFISTLGNTTVLPPLIVVIIAWLLIIRRWRAALCTTIAATGTIGFAWLIKHLYYSPRPLGIFSNSISSSFPSGHATCSIIIYGLLAFFLAYKRPKPIRKLIYWAVFVITLSIGISRMYLGAHWLTDIVAASALGLSGMYFGIILFRRQREEVIPWRGLLITFLISLAISVSYHMNRYFKQDLQNSQPYWKVITIPQEQWWQTPNRFIPYYRVDRLGTPTEVLNLQWSGSIDSIRKTMTQHGWQPITSQNYISTLKQIAHEAQNVPHPLLAKLYRDQHPVLEMIKYSTDQTPPLILRLWSADINLTPGKQPLYVGTLYFQPTTKPFFSFLHRRKEQPLSMPTELHYLLPSMQHYQWNTKQIKTTDLPKALAKTKHPQEIILIKPE